MSIWKIFDLKMSRFHKAKEIILTPLDADEIVGIEELTKEKLLWMAVKKREIVKVSGEKLKILLTRPRGTVQITPNTIIKIKNKTNELEKLIRNMKTSPNI